MPDVDLREIEDFLAEYRTADGRNWREAAERMALAREAWKATGTGWRSRLRDWARDNEVSDSERSRMLKVCDTLRREDARDLTAQKQRQLADAVSRGADYSEAVSAALVLSASDFKAEWLGVERVPAKMLCCPCGCGFRGIPAEFKESE